MLEEPGDVAASRCSTLLRYTWKICTCLFSHVTLVSLVVSYCIMGAFTFQNLEAHNEIKVRLCCFLVVFLWLPPISQSECGERTALYPDSSLRRLTERCGSRKLVAKYQLLYLTFLLLFRRCRLLMSAWRQTAVCPYS